MTMKKQPEFYKVSLENKNFTSQRLDHVLEKAYQHAQGLSEQEEGKAIPVYDNEGNCVVVFPASEDRCFYCDVNKAEWELLKVWWETIKPQLSRE